MRKKSLKKHSSCFMQETAPKTRYYSKNEIILKMAKNGHNAKAIAHAKWAVWDKNEVCEKLAKNVCTNTLKLFYAKNGSKKKLIFKKWPQCKGHSPCKILTLGQKIKLPKTCEKRLYEHIRVVLCKKRLQKTANTRKMRPI